MRHGATRSSNHTLDRRTLVRRRAWTGLMVAAILASISAVTPLPSLAVEENGAGGAIWYVADGTTSSSVPGCASPDFTGADQTGIQLALNTASSGDTIHICAGTYTFGGPVASGTADLTIEGDSSTATVIDGNGGRIFMISVTPSTTTYRSMTLRGGVSDSGSAIYATGGNVVVEDVRLLDNLATDPGGLSEGAAVRADTSLVLTRVLATGNDNQKGAGGVAYSQRMVVTDSRFERNRAVSVGGSLYVNGSAVVTGSTFLDNTSGSYGGAIHAALDLTVGSSILERNEAADLGGAIRAGSATLDAVLFRANAAPGGGGLATDFGLTARDVDFIDNTAQTGYGGAIQAVNGDVSISDGSFQGNRAVDRGGAIFAAGSVSITDGQFIANLVPTGEGLGGAVFAPGQGRFERTSFVGNQAIGAGGAIRITGVVSVVGGTWSDNSAGTGGAILAESTVDVTGAAFLRNLAGTGGAIWAAAGVSGTDVAFTDNTADSGYAGAISSPSGAVSLSDATFTGNRGMYSGAAIYADSVSVTDGVFVGNALRGFGLGGAVFAAGTLRTERGRFEANAASAQGGALRAGSVVSIATDYVDNTTGGTGGALLAETSVAVTGGIFLRNQAGGDAGAIFAGSRVTVLDARFIENTAGSNGGAIMAPFTTRGTIVRSEFLGNEAVTGSGGAYYAGGDNDAPVLDVTASTFWRNRAGGYGGAISLDQSSYPTARATATVVNGTFVQNDARQYGGALHLYSGYATVVGSTFSGNTARYDGANVQNAGEVGVLTASGSLFDEGHCSVTTLTDLGGSLRTSGATGCGGTVVTAEALALGTLRDNGGPTMTVALGSGSPAIDAAGTCGLATDQRGVVRPQSNDCDAGAYEWVPSSVATQLTLRGTPLVNGNPTPTSGDAVVDRAWVTSTLGSEPSGGTVTFSYCHALAVLTDCTAGTPIATVALTDGTSGSDGIGEATLPAWKPAGGWRTGTYLIRTDFEPAAGTLHGPASDASPATESIRIAGADYWVGDGTGSSAGCAEPDFSSGGAALDDDLVRSAVDFALTDGIAFNTIHLCAGTYAFDEQVSITTGDDTTGIEIVGEGASSTIVDGGDGTRLFHVDSATGVAFRDLTLTNGAVTGNGGAIESVSDGTLVLDTVELTGNTASVDGGALWVGAALELLDTTFAGNATGLGGQGGAIRASAGITGVGVTFRDNAAGSGGAIAATGTISLTDGTFERNGTTAAGGAIFGEDDVTLDRVAFEDNTAGTDGGAIKSTGLVAVSDGSFRGNSSETGGGGAIYVTGTMLIRDTAFTDDTAGTDGGDLAATGAISVLGSTTFTGSRAGDDGGAIFSGGTVTLRGATVTDASAGTDGGAVYANDDILIVFGTYTANRAGTGGGAIYTHTDLEISGATFVSNEALGGAGGAAYCGGVIVTTCHAAITDGTFAGNRASTIGGALHTGGSVASETSTYRDNSSGASGGAISANAAVASDRDTFERNTADGKGGAIAGLSLDPADSLLVTDGTFDENSAGTDGGGLYASNGSVVIRGGDYTGNVTGDGFGGAVKAALDVSISDATFVANTAINSTLGYGVGGGAVYAEGRVSATDATFTDNSTWSYVYAKGEGGAVWAKYGFQGLRVRFTGSRSDGLGGAVRILLGDAAITDGTFLDNAAAGSGGALSIGFKLRLERSELSGNTAGYGGAVNAGREIELLQVDFVENRATSGSGGAISAGRGIRGEHVRFEGNEATADGGAIHNFTPYLPLALTDGSFIGNHANRDGGAVFVRLDTALDDVAFIGNSAGRDGGALLGATGWGVLQATDFSSNSAVRDGGAIWWSSEPLTVRDSSLVDSTAGRNGGAIFDTGWIYDHSVVRIHASSILRSEASGRGGAIYADDRSDVEATGSTFAWNHAAGGAGAIHSDRTVSVTDATFVANTADGGTGNAIQARTTVRLLHTTLVDNTSDSGPTASISSGDLTATDSIIADGGCVGDASPTAVGAVFVTDASCPGTLVSRAALRLGELADNGGPTWTVALQAGSVAIDPFDASDPCLLAVDQRGASRPKGETCDAGAFEYDGTRIRTRLSIGGTTPLLNGLPSPTSGDAVSASIEVTGVLGHEPAGSVHLFLCRDAGWPVECTAGTPLGTVSLSDGTSDSDGIAVARFGPWSPAGGWRLGTYQIRSVYDPSAGTSDEPAEDASSRYASVRVRGGDLWVGDGAAGSGACLSPDFSSGGGALTDDLVRDAVDYAAENGVDADTIHLCAGTYAFDETVVITTGDDLAGLTLVGAGRDLTILDGLGGRRHLILDTTSATTIRDLRVTNGVESGSGGSIQSLDDGSLLLERVDATGNTAMYGGVLWTDTADVELLDVHFTDDSAGMDGGAVRAGGSVTVTGSTFERNLAGASGGAISVRNDARLERVVFLDNTAGDYAGAVVATGDGMAGTPGTIAVTDGTFARNSADYGGSLYASDPAFTNLASIRLERVDFTADTAVDGAGGSVMAEGPLTGFAVSVRGSSAYARAGAIYATTVDLSGATFVGNTAGEEGGALRTEGPVSITDGVFIRNTAGMGPACVTSGCDGGAILAFDWMRLERVELSGNTAADAGGAIEIDGPVTGLAVIARDNSAGLGGGAIEAYGAVEITDGTFARNVAGTNGGAISSGADVSVVDGDFEDNTAATGGGGAIHTAFGAVRLASTNARGNTAASVGGAICATALVEISGGTFERNTSGGPGGAIWVLYGTDGSVSVTDATFTGNSATGGEAGDGGAIYARTVIAVTGGSFSGNHATGDGGALFGDLVGVTVTGATFSENTADTHGGAIYAEDGSIAVHGSTFVENSAGTAGGAILTNHGGVSIGTSSFTRNRAMAGGAGGGAFFARTTSEVTASTFVGNQAVTYGGAIDVANGASLSVTNSTFVGNTASEAGAIYGDVITLTHVTLVENTTGTNSTQVRANGDVTLDHVLFASAGGGENCSFGGASADLGGTLDTGLNCLFYLTPGPGSASGVALADLALGSLADNGGPTETVALGPKSVAIDVTESPCTTEVDQRGRPRGGFGCDAGAYERQGVIRLFLRLLDNPVDYGRVARWVVELSTGTGALEVTTGTISLSDGTRPIGSCDLATTPTPGRCEFSNGTFVRDFYVGLHPMYAAYSGSVDPEISPADATANQYVIRNGTVLLYTGPTYFVPAPARISLQASLSDLVSGGGCVAAGKTLEFYRDLGDGTYSQLIGTATTLSNGDASTATTDFSTGINEVLVRFPGDGTCEPGVTTASLLADVSAGTSSGGGHYTVPGVGKVNVAYTVSVGSYRYRGVDYTTITGSLTWHTNAKFRMKGTITGFAKVTCPVQSPAIQTGAVCGFISGYGTLSMWVSSTDGTTPGRWYPIATGIGFRSWVADGGAPPVKGNGNGKGGGSNSNGGGKAYTDWYRMDLPTAVVLGETATLQDLKGGNAVIR